ncbi:hypothetical protein ORI20_32200 [Mycobacterium sp. CVI_P3]|uniref:Serine dehydrogenase proteinase n=1 Tax=Mycobacterium pinniadriaticum TaxID=2994102 RepID=A0ABT3SP95_9MYCO|nr:hypothetical protein [Mycobacterium pinniadriaticum]MCX2934927.1 hypothetical protein [Mycobacterium pinniadriaticum]MCX2941358.1 hypothetical protein [Mycobacterium pinniadriaticum]
MSLTDVTADGISEAESAAVLDSAAGGMDEAAAGEPAAPEEVQFYASLHPGPNAPLPADFGAAVLKLQEAMGAPVWLLTQGNHSSPYCHLDSTVRKLFMRGRNDLRSCEKIVLVIDSGGGMADAAYQIATMLRRHVGSFTAIVPRYAKSAATLLALGAEKILMGSDAEFGPLDVQLLDPDREEWGSALDEIQALERLNVASFELLDQVMSLLLMRTDKKVESLLPHVINFTTQMMRPLLEKIETVHYNQQSRTLKVAEDYAVRLLDPYYPISRAQDIARHLVSGYSEHGFVIDRDEASSFLDIGQANEDQARAIDELEEILTMRPITAIGRVLVTKKGDEDEE